MKKIKSNNLKAILFVVFRSIAHDHQLFSSTVQLDHNAKENTKSPFDVDDDYDHYYYHYHHHPQQHTQQHQQQLFQSSTPLVFHID